MRVSEDEFEALVVRALERLPAEFGDILDNVAVVIETEPEPEVLADLGEDEILGLYRGVPLSQRDSFYSALPDEVVLYRGPLLRLCRNRRELMWEIRDTLVHELGHHFGLSDEEMPY